MILALLAASASTAVMAQGYGPAAPAAPAKGYTPPAAYKPKPKPKPAAKPASNYAPANTGGYGPATTPASGGGYGGNTAIGGDVPPNARPGQCFARLFIPPVVEHKAEQVQVAAAYDDIRVKPAVWDWVDTEVTLKEGRTEYRTIPATYKTVTETVVVRAAYKKTETIPAVTRTRTEQVMVREAYTTWQKGTGLGQGYTLVNGQTRVSAGGEIMCLVQVPAEYKTVTYTDIVTPETTKVTEIPAVTKVVERQVIDQQPRVEEIKIPPVKGIKKVWTLVKESSTEVVKMPAVYKTVTKDIVVAGGKFDWTEILCHTNTTPEIIGRVQIALAKEGYYKGKRTGVFGQESWVALKRYQADHHLPEGQLTIETVKALNVSY